MDVRLSATESPSFVVNVEKEPANGAGWIVSSKNGAHASRRESRGKTIDYRIYNTVNVQICIHLCFSFHPIII